MKIGIVGGGIMGITLGHFLAGRGAQIEVFEGSPALGGLAGPLQLPDGTTVDRFYHAILPSDDHLLSLCAELNIAERLRFRAARSAFYESGHLHPLDSPRDYLRFPPLGGKGRIRLGLTVAYARLMIRDWRRLERIPVETWLRRIGGNEAFERFWQPLLASKFDGHYADVPATYVWSRFGRMKATRNAVPRREEAGYLRGGYATLLAAMRKSIEASGGRIHLQRPVQEIVIRNGRATALRAAGETLPFDAIVATVPVPGFARLIPEAPSAYRALLGRIRYLGIVCPLLVLPQPLSSYWIINVGDTRVPFTGVIETTSYIDPAEVNGHHLVYVPKYLAPESEVWNLSDAQVREMWLRNLQLMFPGFRETDCRYFLVQRERLTEPLHGLAAQRALPEVATPIGGLYLVTTAQIYPALTNGESVTRHARAAAATILDRRDAQENQAGGGQPLR